MSYNLYYTRGNLFYIYFVPIHAYRLSLFAFALVAEAKGAK